MKRYWYAAALAMGLVFMCCSCGGKGGKNDDATPTETELTDVSDAEITETETDTYDEEADGGEGEPVRADRGELEQEPDAAPVEERADHAEAAEEAGIALRGVL